MDSKVVQEVCVVELVRLMAKEKEQGENAIFGTFWLCM